MKGWAEFRPYSPALWRWLRATYQGVPFMLSSATLSTESLDRIKLSLGIDREDVKVLNIGKHLKTSDIILRSTEDSS